MAGTFINGEVKVRPGTYFNVQKSNEDSIPGSIDGVVAVLFRSDWGPLGEAEEVSAGEGYESIFGNGGTTDVIGHAFEGGARTVVCCRIGEGGTPGSIKLKLVQETEDAVEITAKYAGSRAFTVTVRDNISDETKRECILYAGAAEFERVTFEKGIDEAAALVEAFASSAHFKAVKCGNAQGSLAEVLQAPIERGTDPAANNGVTAADYSNGLAVLESRRFNTICVDTEDAAIHVLVNAFLERIFNAGQLAQAVVAEKGTVSLEERMAHAAAFNTEKMVYVLNANLISTARGPITGYQAAARVGGMIAACASNKSLTHTVLDGITQLGEELTPTQMTRGESMGCLVLSANSRKQVWIDSAINTLVIPAENQDNGWKKIRRTKTRYELITRANNQADDLIGKVDNDANGRATIVNQIQGVGLAMIEEGKLISCSVTENPEQKADGDSAWFHIDCVDKDSAEHIYMTYRFRFSSQG